MIDKKLNKYIDSFRIPSMFGFERVKMGQEYNYFFCRWHKDYFRFKTSILHHLNKCPVCRFHTKGWILDTIKDPVSYSGVTGYPGNTEYLTTTGWKPFTEYTKGEPVAVYDIETGYCTLEVPAIRYVKKGTRMCTIDDGTMYLKMGYHSKVLIETPRGLTTRYLWYLRSSQPAYRLVDTFKVRDIPLDMDEDQFKLLLKILTFSPSDMNNGKIRVQAFDRRNEKLRSILDEAGIDYVQTGSNRNSAYMFDWSLGTEMPFNWYWLSTHYRKILLDTFFGTGYSITTAGSKSNKDILAFNLHLAGDSNGFEISEDEWGREYYKIHRTKKPEREIHKKHVIKDALSCTAYGFNTRTGYLLLRQNNSIFIGTDGKYEEK